MSDDLTSKQHTRMLPCPLCGCDDLETSPWPANRDRTLWVARCGNPECGCEVSAKTINECAQRWNRRVSEPPSDVQRDAERYRWLREQDRDRKGEVCISFNVGHDWQQANDLDYEVDDRRAAVTKPAAPCCDINTSYPGQHRSGCAGETSAPPCEVPPAGWKCTRGANHDGPCAAVSEQDE